MDDSGGSKVLKTTTVHQVCCDDSAPKKPDLESEERPEANISFDIDEIDDYDLSWVGESTQDLRKEFEATAKQKEMEAIHGHNPRLNRDLPGCQELSPGQKSSTQDGLAEPKSLPDIQMLDITSHLSNSSFKQSINGEVSSVSSTAYEGKKQGNLKQLRQTGLDLLILPTQDDASAATSKGKSKQVRKVKKHQLVPKKWSSGAIDK